ncbi:hypothetical protein SAMN02745181_0604 [Rubritalea squalenifaciens DSM 18772]|uniref:Lipoprotein n=1 Tax=Rubritalea squalenifaciens DSM 18772 TaxID=1123071 RepID=A0A1M6CZP5_9BACT|nr:hypothetical protein [Rubritalea squalenifaciens]SHI66198.1 hypothetical protein SAMN02745181_0604 [Rubritalea squalenifaciens DSM 18772]
MSKIISASLLSIAVLITACEKEAPEQPETEVTESAESSTCRQRFTKAHELMKQEQDTTSLQQARELLRSLQQEYPDWNPSLVQNRLDKCEKLLGVED